MQGILVLGLSVLSIALRGLNLRAVVYKVITQAPAQDHLDGACLRNGHVAHDSQCRSAHFRSNISLPGFQFGSHGSILLWYAQCRQTWLS